MAFETEDSWKQTERRCECGAAGLIATQGVSRELQDLPAL